MDARARLTWAAAIALVTLGCGGATPRGRGADAGGDGCDEARVLARGALAYDAVVAGDAVYAIELETRFALVVHDAATGAIRATIDLGGAERDLLALAVDPARRTAYVGGKDQAVRAIDLARGAVIATWPIGADVTALAADGDHLAIGDAAGAVCLRRASDGALLQCLTEGDAPIAAVEIAADGLRVRAGGLAYRYALPSLAAADRPRAWRAPSFRPPVELGGPIRAVHVTPAGTVVAAWVHDLDDPSVVLVARKPCAP